MSQFIRSEHESERRPSLYARTLHNKQHHRKMGLDFELEIIIISR